MIYVGNLILRAMVFEYFNNFPYFKSYERFFRKIRIFTMGFRHIRKYQNMSILDDSGIAFQTSL